MKTSTIVILSIVLASSGANAQTSLNRSLFTRSGGKNVQAIVKPEEELTPIAFKSVTLAVTLSVLVPGTGELYAGNFGTGKYAMMAEAAIWVTYAALTIHGNWIRQDARVFATQHAGASFSSKGDQFDVDIGNYFSQDEYNQSKLRTRDIGQLYIDPSYYWKWDSDADRIAFKNARIRSDEIYQNGKFVIAAAVVNRIFSAFSAGRAAAAYNRKLLYDGAWNLEAKPTSDLHLADGLMVDLTYTF